MAFPHFKQLDSMDCGPSCLRIIAAFYGRQYSVQNLRERCHISREGVSLLGISDAAEAIGFRTAGVKITWKQLREEANLPCIVHWHQRHFVVVYKIEKKRGKYWVYVSDPAEGLLKYSEEQFLRAWLHAEAKPTMYHEDRPVKSYGRADIDAGSVRISGSGDDAGKSASKNSGNGDDAGEDVSVTVSANGDNGSEGELTSSDSGAVSGRHLDNENSGRHPAAEDSGNHSDFDKSHSRLDSGSHSNFDQSGRRGIALLLEPTPAFYNEKGDEDKRFNFTHLLKYLKPYKRYLVQLVLAMLTGSILSLILPFLTQSVVDTGIGTGNLNFILVILIAQVMLVVGQLANNLIKNWLMLHMTTRISISLISDFLSKLMRLPIAFFDSKNVGDIMQRIGDYGRIQSFLTGSLLSMAMGIVSFIIYGVIMAGYNSAILVVFLLGSAVYVLWIVLFLKRRRKLDYMRFQEAAANQSNIVQMIGGMQDIKLNNCEKQKRWEWERIQAKLFKVSIKSLTLGQTQEIGGTFIDQTKNVIISFMAAAAVINGNMTLGMMVAMQYIIGQLNAPISQFISFMQATQDAKISMERLGEIHEKKDEEPEEEQLIRNIPAKADIEFQNVVFQYDGPHSDKVLNNINLKIPNNKVTAIVGASGSGKTTLLKLILGFYEPIEGKVLLNNRTLDKYSDSCWRSKCGTVMQEGYIFSDTIANNIGISTETPDMERVRRAADTANIDEFVEGLPLGYNTKIGADGSGLSTGQKQRMLIARAAYKDADYLLFDEATNSLDANNEKAIMQNLDKLFRGKTVVIVAHRLSTVKNADNIVVLDKGEIVEEGTHNQLVRKKGYYYELVKNQLELGN